MGEATQQIYTDNPGPLPAEYVIPPGLDLQIQSIVARLDGSAAASRFLPCLSIYSQDNRLVGRFHPERELAVGDTGVVTWAPFLGRGAGQTTPAVGVNRPSGDPLTIPSGAGAPTFITWTGEEYDTDGMWDPANPTRFTPQRPGRWALSCYVVWAATAGADFREIRFVENLSGNLVVDGKTAVPGIETGHTLAATFYFNTAPVAGQYVQVGVKQNSGAGLVVNSLAIAWSMVYLGPI